MNWEGREREYSLSIVTLYLDMHHVVSEENRNNR